MSAESTVVKNYRVGVVYLEDGGAGSLLKSYEVKYEDGDFGFDYDKDGRIVVRDRGEIVGLLPGEQAVTAISFTVDMREFTHETTDTIVDVIEQTGNWRYAISAAPAGFVMFCHTLRFTAKGIAFGDTANHEMKIERVLLVWSFKEGDRNKLSIKGEVYGKVTRLGPA